MGRNILIIHAHTENRGDEAAVKAIEAVDECLGYIVSELNHGLQILKGTATNCARK